MPEILLATINARYLHASFGLRYLLANLGLLASKAEILEFEIKQRALEIAERILARNPRIVGLGVYIWNVSLTTEVVGILKRVRPELLVVLGGPEVSYESEGQKIVGLADYVITGEGELKFAELCQALLAGIRPGERIIPAGIPMLTQATQPALPYHLYTDEDLAHRLVYVEASRGCPFSCEFCLSSLEIPVRQFELEPLLGEFEKLLGRGLRHFKFVDRTFNLNLSISRAILEFFLACYEPGLFLHFEMVPDRLPEALREIIARFPPGSLQFEVGIQTFNPEVATLISRRQDYARMEENFRFLREQTGVHLHADLILGLPGETVESFGAGFDRLIALGPQEIQVGILKRLRGTPISRHDSPWEMVYCAEPPYEILCNKLIDFSTMQRLRRFARYWDLVGNSGNFRSTLRLIFGSGSPFESFLAFSDWLYARVKRTDSISLNGLAECIFEYLTGGANGSRQIDPDKVGRSLAGDFKAAGRKEFPEIVRPYLQPAEGNRAGGAVVAGAKKGPRRQARHESTPG